MARRAFRRKLLNTRLAKYVKLPGIIGNAISTPDSPIYDALSSLSIRCKVSPDDWDKSGAVPSQTWMGKWNTGALTKSFLFLDNPSAPGGLRFAWSDDGTTQFLSASTVPVPFIDGDIGGIRVDWDITGGVNSITTFFTSLDMINWTMLGTPVVNALTGPIANTDTPVVIGAYANFSNDRWAGEFYYGDIRITPDGAPIAVFNPNRALINADTVSSPTGEVWTINRAGGGQVAQLF